MEVSIHRLIAAPFQPEPKRSGPLTEAGLRPGDVLTEINDTRIDGMGTLIGLWPRLQNASELRATVLRNGQRVSLNLTLK